MRQTKKLINFQPVAIALFLACTVACGSGTGKGDKLLESGDLEGAASAYRKAYEKKTTNKVALIKFGRTLFELNNKKKDEDQKVSADEWQEAFELLERGRTVEPVPPEVDPIKDYELQDSAFEAGRAFAEAGKHKEAVKLLVKAKSHGKSGAKLHEYLARSMQATGDRSGAVDAALEAINSNTMDGKLLREGALLAMKTGRLGDCHELMLVSEALEPAGFKYWAWKDIQLMCSRSYFFLTTGLLETIFTTRRLSAERVKQWKADEALMTKNWEHYQKRRPEEIMKEDKAYFMRILYHLYITHGMGHVLLCEFDIAKQWWENADLIDKERIEAPKNVSEEALQAELTWPQHNIQLLEKLSK